MLARPVRGAGAGWLAGACGRWVVAGAGGAFAAGGAWCGVVRVMTRTASSSARTATPVAVRRRLILVIGSVSLAEVRAGNPAQWRYAAGAAGEAARRLSARHLWMTRSPPRRPTRRQSPHCSTSDHFHASLDFVVGCMSGGNARWASHKQRRTCPYREANGPIGRGKSAQASRWPIVRGGGRSSALPRP